jgi:protein-disulfide isomerase
MGEKLFANAESLTEDTIKDKAKVFAKEIGLNDKTFATCLESDKIKQKVEADKKEGAAVGVGSTPSFVINGRLKRGMRNFQDLKVVIDEKLMEAKK